MSTLKIQAVEEIARQRDSSPYAVFVDAYRGAFNGLIDRSNIRRAYHTYEIGMYNDENIPFWLREYVDNWELHQLAKTKYAVNGC